jgi:hypothetical protein
MIRAVVRNLPEKSGRSLDEWVALVASKGPKSRKSRVEWLKNVHHLGHVTAQIVAGEADRSLEKYDDRRRLVAGLFGGPKAPARTIYEALLAASEKLPEVRVSPCKTYVSLVRARQFARIKPRGRNRIDLYLDLEPRSELSPRLERVRGSLARRVTLSDPSDVDGEIRGWLRAAAKRGGS